MKITINTTTNQITEEGTEFNGNLIRILCEYLADKIYQQEPVVAFHNELLGLATDFIESCINEHVREDWS